MASMAKSEKRQRSLPLALMVITLCALSFYFGGSFCSQKATILEVNQDGENEQVVRTELVDQTAQSCNCITTSFKQPDFPVCNRSTQDLTPCTDPERWWRYDRDRLAFRERHCPSRSERLQCLIPPPEGYKVPIKWPASRNECWYRNVPFEWINAEKSNQHWLHKSGEKFIFPGGGTMFPNGVGEYLDQMEEILPEMKDGSIRTAFDTGCGVASWGGYLLDRNILTMSLAPRDNHEAQVQFALERGIPAILGIIATQRLPFPAGAFDMAHCSRCLIPWTIYGGAYMLELDRVIRPGGFWVLSGPPINYKLRWKGWDTTREKQEADLEALQELLTGMCYKLYAMEGDIAVWQKSVSNDCYKKRTTSSPPLCDDSLEPDGAWYIPTRSCIVTQPPGVKNIGVGQIPRWPKRLTAISERLRAISGVSGASFRMDSAFWLKRVGQYKEILPQLGTNKIRNIMDMNTRYGGFAAALINDPVWVMNVVSSYGVNSLGIVYDRGLIGTVTDWCEAFSTYPRTYDLLHVQGLFTAESHRCEMKFVMLEMDRILRPSGYAIISDAQEYLDKAKIIGKAMCWKCNQHETGSDDTEGLLICEKKFWVASEPESDV